MPCCPLPASPGLTGVCVYVYKTVWMCVCVCFSPISESRRVLQESCEFFLKHNSRVQQHKSKHYKSSSHKLKVVSKSTGTSTGMHTPVTGNHDNTPVSTAIHNHSVCDVPGSSERIGSTERRSKADAESLHRFMFYIMWIILIYILFR